MESESENENEDEENQTYTTYPAGETLINTSPQHIPQETNNTVTSPIVIGIQKNGDDLKISRQSFLQINNLDISFFFNEDI